MDNNEKLEYTIEKLWIDYLDLCESYAEEMPLHEFGFAMIRNVSKMLFDTAPNEMVARETIRVAVEEGHKWANSDLCTCEDEH